MIKDGHRLPEDVIDRIPVIIDKIQNDTDVVALYTFGSLATGDLKPLSDLDFGILVSCKLTKQERFDKHLDLFFRDAFDDAFLKGIDTVDERIKEQWIF